MLPRRELHHGLEDWPRRYGTSVWLAHLEHAAPHLVHHVARTILNSALSSADASIRVSGRMRTKISPVLQNIYLEVTLEIKEVLCGGTIGWNLPLFGNYAYMY